MMGNYFRGIQTAFHLAALDSFDCFWLILDSSRGITSTMHGIEFIYVVWCGMAWHIRSMVRM